MQNVNAAVVCSYAPHPRRQLHILAAGPAPACRDGDSSSSNDALTALHTLASSEPLPTISLQRMTQEISLTGSAKKVVPVAPLCPKAEGETSVPKSVTESRTTSVATTGSYKH